MTPQASPSLFLLGVAAGLTALTMTAYRRVSPSWLKWLLLATGVLTLSRYIVMTCFAEASSPDRLWSWGYGYSARSIGFTLPSVMAIDQLLRHPKMSPQRLLRWITPLLLVDALMISVATLAPQLDRLRGWVPAASGWQSVLIGALWAFSVVQWVFMIGFMGVIALLLRQPYLTQPARRALWALLLAYVALGVEEVSLAIGRWLIPPLLYPDMVALLALWYAYDTSAALSQVPGS